MKNMRAQGVLWRGLYPRRRVILLGAPMWGSMLLLSLLLTGLVLLRPAPAAHATAAIPRLEFFLNSGGVISHQWSDDHGSTWSAWTNLPTFPNRVNGENLFGTPAVVSDGDGILTVVELTTWGSLVTSTYITGANAWSGWTPLPGLIAGTAFTFGHVSISGNTYSIEDRLPTLTSWGPGRMELFIFGTNVTTGDGVLLHSWADNYSWSGRWETLGTGMRSDDYTRPAAVSWGPGRDDVFVRGVNSDLQHAYFANGSWSGWESLGGYITSDPTAASRQANIVDVFVRGTDAALWSRAYVNGWYNWYSLGGSVQDGQHGNSGPTAISVVPGTLDVYAASYDTSGTVYRQSYDATSWLGWVSTGSAWPAHLAVATWTPVAPPPPPTPTATPRPPICPRPCLSEP
jgi:hypothetical protein